MSITKSKFKQTEIGELPKEWELITVSWLVENGVIESPLDGNHGGIHPKSSDYVSVGMPFISAADINNGNVDLINCHFIRKSQADSLQKGFAKKGDVLITHKATIGRTAIVPDIDWEYIVLTPQVTYFRVKNPAILNGPYLKYYFDSQNFQKLFQNWAGGGSTRAYIGITKQLELPILLPPISTQQQIASILSSLDDKIELNRKMNKTLEDMAKALFKHWFVENADKDGEMTKIGQVVEVKGGTTPSTTESEYWEGDIHWTSPRDLSNKKSIFLTTTERKISKEGLAVISSGLLPIGTVLLSSRAPIGYLAITDIPVAINQGYIAILCNKGISNYYVYFWLQNNMDRIVSVANGSTFLEISKSNFKQLDFLKPPDEKLAKFDLIVGPIFSEIRINEYEMQSLSLIRDSLLPKLMSGKIRV